MSEFIFVLKTFVATLVIIFCMQMKIGGVTLENRFHHWVRTSSISHSIQTSASGAALALDQGFSIVKTKAKGLWRNLSHPKPSNK